MALPCGLGNPCTMPILAFRQEVGDGGVSWEILDAAFPIYKKKYLGATNNGLETTYSFQNEYGYYPKRALGFEANIPLKKINFKFEGMVSDDFYALPLTDRNKPAIINAIESLNQGYDSIPIYQSIVAMGIDANFDEWFYNFYLMKIHYMKNPSVASFWSVFESENGPVKFKNIPPFPTLNIGRYFSNEKRGVYGLVLGYFTGALGAFLYVTNQLNESLSWSLSSDLGLDLTTVELLSENSDDDSPGQDTNYLFVEPTFTFGLGYKL